MLGRKKKGKEELHTANKIKQEKINKNKGSKKIPSPGKGSGMGGHVIKIRHGPFVVGMIKLSALVIGCGAHQHHALARR